MSRLFIALTPDENLNKEIIGIKSQLKELLLKDSGLTWTQKNHHHITINFIGPMEPEQIEEMYSNLEEIEVLGAAIRLEVTGVSYFPNENSQVLVANISIPTQLQKLRSQVQALVSQIGFDTNQKGYKPHITLARFKNKARPFKELIVLEEPIKTSFSFLDIYESSFESGKTTHKMIKRFNF